MSAIDQNAPPRCYLCGGTHLALVSDIRRKPLRETDFGILPENYSRQVYQCPSCSVYLNIQRMIGPEIYANTYNAATYRRNLQANYARIRALPEESSDNKQRVRRVMEFNAQLGRAPADTRVLDVGSGLCVFLGELKTHGFHCYCLDPDPLSVQHALERVKVDGAHVGTLDDYPDNQQFDIITFNKVLEHVPEPTRALTQAKRLLTPNGFVYIELPDAEGALRVGGAVEREEFYIEHYTIFTSAAISFLSQAAGFRCLEMTQIHEPSDKYTLYGFLRVEM
jgi:SAM-dependent methyltransferase